MSPQAATSMEIAEEVRMVEFGEDLFDAHAVFQEGVEAWVRAAAASALAMASTRCWAMQSAVGGLPEEVFEDFVGDAFFAHGEDAGRGWRGHHAWGRCRGGRYGRAASGSWPMHFFVWRG